ncbi:coiled-coil domain-containing protein 86 [Frankliniella occidentalis]|uniref:Coiled-coil domain-containing protein 86 n=1 Tax=Frankliniella occidentalis TaxID=133901 RepID=A0A6J1RTT7_FRAOC|nr:coiled-coil domain-containing protein 86 [Frankliniella occidentalis]
MTQKTDKDAVSLRIQSILSDSQSELKEQQKVDSDSDSSDEETHQKTSEVRGKRPGNRFWKKDRKRFSSVVATRGLKRITWDQKEKLRHELKHAKQLSRTLKEERSRVKQETRERRQENLKRREENARKSEIVTVIKNTSKLKRLKKKQLRSIEKRDTSGKV